MPAYDLPNVIGNLTPIDQLQRELTRAGVQVEFHIGEVSPRTPASARVCAGDAVSGRTLWRIYCPAGSPAHQVYHELLHVKWYDVDRALWLHGAPSANADYREALAELNNDLDHAHILRQEIAAYPEAAAYWERDFTALYDRQPAPTSPELALRWRLTLQRGWMILPHALPGSAVTARYARALAAGGWLAQASRMTTRVQAAGTDKATAIAALREAMEADIPAAVYCAFSYRLPAGALTLAAESRPAPTDSP